MDLCEVGRMRSEIAEGGPTFLQNIFTPEEISYCDSRSDPAQHFAARFAAKEACLKAIPWGSGQKSSWLEIAIVRKADGQPVIELRGELKKLAEVGEGLRVHVSLTHTPELAAAVVIVEGGTSQG